MSGSTALPSVPGPVRTTRRLRALVELLGFWVAVVLPFLYLPTLALGGLVSMPPPVLAAAVGLNVFCLLLGHRHDPGYRH